MKVRLYARVSHEEQVKFGSSINAQISSLKEYCEENNYTVKGIYVDEGISAATLKKRHEFIKMINECRENEIILFTKLDRFSRNLLDANIIVKELEEKKVSIKAILEDDIDTSSADGKFIFNLKLSLAQREREKTSERINEVFKYKAKNGESISGKIPFGYKVINKKYVHDEKKSTALLEAFTYYNTYSNLSDTLKYFNSKYPEFTMEYGNFKKMLRNRIYIGEHKYNKNFCKGIIPIDLFESVQTKLKKNIRTRKNNNIFLFSGLVECSQCGRSMAGNRTIRKYSNPNWTNRDYYVYRCNNAYQNRKCNNRHILSESKVEKYLLENVRYLLKERLISIQIENKHKDTSNDIAKLKRKLSKLKDLYLDDFIDKKEYEQDYRRLNEELSKLNKPKTKDDRLIKEFLNINLHDVYETLDRKQKQALWHTIIEKIIFYEDKTFKIYFV